MSDDVFWQRGPIDRRSPLEGNTTAAAVIVGGGMAGLTVAQELLARGITDIVLLDADYCGAGATGRSSGFITPPSELQMAELRARFGDDDARTLWTAARSACDAIQTTLGG